MYDESSSKIINLLYQILPRHRGLGEEYSTFFRKDARSNPVANSKKPGHRRIKIETQRKKNWKRYKRRPMNDHIDARAGPRKGLDPKPLREKRKRDSIWRMWIVNWRKRENRDRERGASVGMKHEAPEEPSVKHETSPVGAYLTPLKCYPSSRA